MHKNRDFKNTPIAMVINRLNAKRKVLMSGTMSAHALDIDLRIFLSRSLKSNNVK